MWYYAHVSRGQSPPERDNHNRKERFKMARTRRIKFSDRDAVFFYINLGLSRKRLMAVTLSIDFGFLLLLEILIVLCR